MDGLKTDLAVVLLFGHLRFFCLTTGAEMAVPTQPTVPNPSGLAVARSAGNEVHVLVFSSEHQRVELVKLVDRNTPSAVTALERLLPDAMAQRWAAAASAGVVGITYASRRRVFRGVLPGGLDGADFTELLANTVVRECIDRAVELAHQHRHH